MTAAVERGSTSPWRSLTDAPLLLAAWCAVACGSLAVLEVGSALRRAASVRHAAAPQLARLAAETALADVLQRDPAVDHARVDVGGVVVTVAREPGAFLLTGVVGAEVYRFRAAEVEGAAPEVFAHACSALDPASARLVSGSRLVTAEQLPKLDPAQLSAAAHGDQMALFRQDEGVALLAWESGTDKPDYVLDAARTAELDRSDALVVLRGNLWIEAGEQPLRITLQRDHVVVVRGNLYIGRPIVVDGPGRLVFVTRTGTGERAFADLDANGRWSAGDRLCEPGDFVGPAEGAGNVYLGLPGSVARIACDVSLVVGGELHLGAAARISGPVVLGHGATAGSAGARLDACRKWVFRVDRETVPGFVTDGVPRPGVLVRIDAEERGAQQGLYLSAPAR